MADIREHAVIIGGTSGIGLATAKRLLADGLKVTIAGRSPAKLDAALGSLTGEVSGRQVDATAPVEIAAFFGEVGPFDHLVMAASGGKGLGPFATLDFGDVRDGFDEKVWPHLRSAQAALPHIAGSGSITFVSAVSARMAAPGIAGIAMINGALLTVVPILAVELKPLRINAVSPGVIDTPWWDFLPADQRRAVFDDYAAKSTTGRIGTADDVAKAIAFLVSDSFVTGQTITCDGGLHLAAA